VGEESFAVFTTDLLCDTGQRFVQSLLENPPPKGGTAIKLDAADVPAAAAVMCLMALSAPNDISLAKLADVVRAAEFINARGALNALAAALRELRDVSAAALIEVVAVSVAVNAGFGMTARLADMLGGLEATFTAEDVVLFWECVVPLVSPAQCLWLQSCGGGLGRWLWASAGALSCSGSCADFNALPLPTALSACFRQQLQRFMELSLRQPWCACRMRVGLSAASTSVADSQPLSVHLVSVRLTARALRPRCRS